MKATEAQLLDFLKRSPQFAIPIYQRTYSWTERECCQLWDDILRAGCHERIKAHFVGSIVYIEGGLFQVIRQPPLLVIDGQQRLTTVSLIIEALARQVGEDEPVDGFSAEKLRSYYLLNHLEKGERRYKLLLTQTDKQTLKAIVDQQPLPSEHSLRLKKNFEFFEKQVRERGSVSDLESLCKGLAKLMVVEISLSREQDNPQLIYESMNSTGRELSQADLIRNFVLMGLEPDHQERLYNDHWRQMEVAFGQEAYGDHFDQFMRCYLIMKTGAIPKVSEVYEAFKEYHRDKVANVDALITDVQTSAFHYCAIALGKETSPVLESAFADLRELKVDVAYPFLLELYRDYTDRRLSSEKLEKIVRLVESYVFRRAVCSIPTNSLNKTFATFGKMLKKDRYLESAQAYFRSLPSYRRFPGDEEFRRELKSRDLYHFARRSYCLRRLENDGRKEWVSVHEYTVEHVMPQNKNLSEEWRDALGAEWKRIHDTYLHTFGNLTLTGYNPEYSDRPFPEKRDMTGGFRESPLRLNEGLRTLNTWNEKAIQDRADCLARKSVGIWASPSLPVETLDTCQPKTEKSDAYTTDDHKYLVDGSHARFLFDVLRKELLAIDPCVTEVFTKSYVAYKGETNFVDVLPQPGGLFLSVNIQFRELRDSRGMAKDVTNLGCWGNGDVEVVFSELQELTYVMGLVRQAFEKQMGDDATT